MDFWSVVTGINGSFSLLLSNISSFIFEIFRSKKHSLNYEFRRSNWRKYSARQFLSWRHAAKAMLSANFMRVSKALVDTTSLVYTENKIGKRTHPCGAPVFTISSSDLVPLRLTLCGWLHRSCLIQRTRVWLAPRSKSLLIRKWGWIVLKANEKSMNVTHTYDPDLSRWLAVRFMRIRHTSSTPLLALWANYRGSMRSATEATNWLHTILSIHFARTDVKATGLKSFICFTLSFFGTGIMIELFHVHGTDMLSRNNWNRQTNTGPICNVHTLSTLPLRPFRPGA